MKKNFAVIINGKVQKQVAALLTERGVSCRQVDVKDGKNAKEVFSGCNTVILPFPSTKANLGPLQENKALKDYFSSEHILVGGMLEASLKQELEEAGVKCLDYFENEAYVLKNAQLTAQGAVRLLLESTERFLVGKKVLITGFGRIGKALALLLKSFGMRVFVAVRREEAAVEASAMGFDVFGFKAIKGTLFYYDYIFNTVPSALFSYRDISHLNGSTIYFELASSPFGADKKDFELLGKNYVFGGALPGRYFPAAVASNIADFILNKEGDPDE